MWSSFGSVQTLLWKKIFCSEIASATTAVELLLLLLKLFKLYKGNYQSQVPAIALRLWQLLKQIILWKIASPTAPAAAALLLVGRGGAHLLVEMVAWKTNC